MNVGEVIRGTVSNIQKTHFIVDLENGYHGIVHVSSTSDYYVASLFSMFQKGHEYNFKIIEVDEDQKRVKLDWKSIHPRFQKNPFKYEIKETENGFKNIKENTEKEVEND